MPSLTGTPSRMLSALRMGLALTAVGFSYLWPATDHRTLGLRNVVVQASGRYTLGETILYFSHFLWEVPVAIAYALFLLGTARGTEIAPLQFRALARLVARRRPRTLLEIGTADGGTLFAHARLAAGDGVVPFHDIVAQPNTAYMTEARASAHAPWTVHDLWREVKGQYRHEEFIQSSDQEGYGIGVLYLGDPR